MFARPPAAVAVPKFKAAAGRAGVSGRSERGHMYRAEVNMTPSRNGSAASFEIRPSTAAEAVKWYRGTYPLHLVTIGQVGVEQLDFRCLWYWSPTRLNANSDNVGS